MSHVNRNDRLSRRILGFLGRVEAVETQNRALAERVTSISTATGNRVQSLAEVVEEQAKALEETRRVVFVLSDALRAAEARIASVERATDAVEPEVALTTTDTPAPVTT